MVLVSDETIEWNCNWKTSVDIFSETYHVRGVHPESEYIADDVNVQMDLYGPHTRFIAPMYISSPRKIGDDKALSETMVDYLKSEGFPVDDFEGDVTILRGLTGVLSTYSIAMARGNQACCLTRTRRVLPVFRGACTLVA